MDGGADVSCTFSMAKTGSTSPTGADCNAALIPAAVFAHRRLAAGAEQIGPQDKNLQQAARTCIVNQVIVVKPLAAWGKCVF